MCVYQFNHNQWCCTKIKKLVVELGIEATAVFSFTLFYVIISTLLKFIPFSVWNVCILWDSDHEPNFTGLLSFKEQTSLWNLLLRQYTCKKLIVFSHTYVFALRSRWTSSIVYKSVFLTEYFTYVSNWLLHNCNFTQVHQQFMQYHISLKLFNS